MLCQLTCWVLMPVWRLRLCMEYDLGPYRHVNWGVTEVNWRRGSNIFSLWVQVRLRLRSIWQAHQRQAYQSAAWAYCLGSLLIGSPNKPENWNVISDALFSVSVGRAWIQSSLFGRTFIPCDCFMNQARAKLRTVSDKKNFCFLQRKAKRQRTPY